MCSSRPELLALNKIDVAPPDSVTALRRACPDALPVSALSGEGVSDLREALAARLRGLGPTALRTSA